MKRAEKGDAGPFPGTSGHFPEDATGLPKRTLHAEKTVPGIPARGESIWSPGSDGTRFSNAIFEEHMADIKSTLELVMERTRNMVFSKDEKKEQDLAEFHKTVSGLIQKVLDGIVRQGDFEKELERMGRGIATDPRRVAAEEIAKRLDLEGDNAALFDLLSGPCRVDTSKARAAVEAYAQALKQGEAEATARLLRRFSGEHGISGIAVTPNLEKDAEWTEALASLRERHRTLLEGAVARF